MRNSCLFGAFNEDLWIIMVHVWVNLRTFKGVEGTPFAELKLTQAAECVFILGELGLGQKMRFLLNRFLLKTEPQDFQVLGLLYRI